MNYSIIYYRINAINWLFNAMNWLFNDRNTNNQQIKAMN